MLDHDRLDLWVGQEFYELGAASIQAGTDLGHGLNSAQAMVVSVHDEAAQLCSKSFLWSDEETLA
jgi:hypothetical protein